MCKSRTDRSKFESFYWPVSHSSLVAATTRELPAKKRHKSACHYCCWSHTFIIHWGNDTRSPTGKSSSSGFSFQMSSLCQCQEWGWAVKEQIRTPAVLHNSQNKRWYFGWLQKITKTNMNTLTNGKTPKICTKHLWLSQRSKTLFPSQNNSVEKKKKKNQFLSKSWDNYKDTVFFFFFCENVSLNPMERVTTVDSLTLLNMHINMQ